METEFLGIKIFDEDFFELFLRGLFNFFINFLIIKYAYLKERKFNSHVFSFYVFSTIIFFICYLMSNVKLDIGVAFGLFAIFSILRYRTDAIPIREMTYLLIVMGVAVINALSNKKVSYTELMFTNFAIVGFVLLLEKYGQKVKRKPIKEAVGVKLNKRDIIYNDLKNIRPQDHALLKQELINVTGLDIQYFDIRNTDFFNKTAQIRLYFKDPDLAFKN